MKKQRPILMLGLAVSLVAQADDLIIKSFDAKGQLTFGEMPAAISYRVDWTTNLSSGAWSSNAPGIAQIPALGAGDRTVTVGVGDTSCYYRVVAAVTNQLPGSLTSAFNLANEDWRIVSYPFRYYVPEPATMPLPYDGNFGNPPGSVRIGDMYSETGITAPAAYLGNKINFYGGSLAYDIYLRYSDNVVYPAVVLNSGTMSLYYDTPSPTVNAWQHMTIPLSETGWKVSNTGKDATEAEFKSVLGNLVGIYIYTEWHSGADDTNVDNISLVPF